jgi:predicted O-methyltransferase YrrM
MNIDNIIDQFDLLGIIPHTLPNAIGMWPNEQECLIWCASQCDPNQDWLEVGAFCGGSAILLGLTQKYLNGNGKVLTVDIDFRDIFDLNLKRSGLTNIIKIQNNSSNLFKICADPISFVFLDGWHSFASIVSEFEQIRNIVVDNGIIGFHDVSPNMWKHNQEYINEKYKYSQNNLNQLFNDTNQNFLLDEAISYICKKYNYHIIDIPVRKNETHFKETGLQQWIRGTTSPFNSFTAIMKD